MSSNDAPRHLSILGFNMQVGIGTKRYREYFTHGWRNLLPSQGTRENLRQIARLLDEHDIIGLQEIDAGSRRSGYKSQIETLARQAGFSYWQAQVNRNLGRVAQHGLGLISRYPPLSVTEHKLPGRVPGRGALIARFGTPACPLTVVVTHLSLGAGSRSQQIAAICNIVAGDQHVIVIGDTNCSATDLMADPAMAASGLVVYDRLLATYPSWRPQRGIDHILVSNTLTIERARVINTVLSDHRPVAMSIGIPPALGVSLAATSAADHGSYDTAT